MPKKLIKPGILLATVFVVISLLFVTVGATSLDLLDGQVSVTDEKNTLKNSSGKITATAKGSMFSKASNTVTITNNSGSKAEISFDYAVDKSSSFKIDGASAATSGTITKDLAAGSSVKLVITSNSGFSNLTVTLTVTNLSCVVVQDSSNVTINFNSTLGSVTAGGNSAANGEVIEGVTKTDGVVLAATPASGATFLGWVDGGGKILSSDATYTLKPASNTTVKAIFGSASKPCFGVGAEAQKSAGSGLLDLIKIYYYQAGISYLFDDLNAAANFAASSSTNKAVVLMNDGTLSAGTYTIPAGVTLLIPFDSANTIYKNEAVSVGSGGKENPSAFRTLTLADGAKLIINGSMSVSGQHKYTSPGGSNDGSRPVGPLGFVNLQGTSSITIMDKGALYVYGYIVGSGSVVAKSGATVYELLQIADFRGGSVTLAMNDKDERVFPFSQYYVQNIEVLLTLESGAKELAYTTIYMSSTTFGTELKFVGDSGYIFNLASGYVTKEYNGDRDRLEINVCGKISMMNTTLDIGGTNVSSKNFDFPVASNMSIFLQSGSEFTAKQSFAILPGCVFDIKEGASFVLGEGYSAYVYDQDEWGRFCYAGNGADNNSSNHDTQIMPVFYAYSKNYTRTVADLVDAKIIVGGTLDVSKGSLYTTTNGANICGAEGGKIIMPSLSSTTTYQYSQIADSDDGFGKEQYVKIAVNPAYLKNANGTYVTPKVADTFKYTNGKWICETHTLVEAQAGKEGTTYSLECGNNCGTCMASVTVAYRLEDYLWLNATVESDLGYEMAGALYQGNYVIRAVGAAEIPNSLLLTFSHNKVSYSLEMNLAAYKTMITDDEDIALIEAMLIYGEAVEDMFGNANKNSAEVTAPSDLPDATQMKDQHESAGNVTVTRYGMTIGFNNCLQFIYGFKVNGETGITDWSNILEIGLLYSPEAGELLAQNSSSAYILYQNEAWSENSGNLPELPEGVTLQDVPKDSTLTKDQLAEMLKDNGCYMITYNMEYADYGTSYNYRPYILFTDGSVAYGEQFAYSLATYIGNRLSVATDTTELHLLWATWNFKTVAEKWKP